MADSSYLDWQSGKTLLECFDHLLTSSIGSDVTFLVGENKIRIPAHKLVLFSRSPVFYAMFEGPLAEQGEITIPDISEQIFRLFLRYLYTDDTILTEDNVVMILCAARKYCVDILVSRCEEFLKKTLSTENVCHYLEQAHLFMIDSLTKSCLELIADSPTVVLQSAVFLDLCPSCVASVTGYNALNAVESDVYKTVIAWGKAECRRNDLEETPENIREVLGDILYTVRFLVMNCDLFEKEVSPDKILPADDIANIRKYHQQLESKDISACKLNNSERKDASLKKVWRCEVIVLGDCDSGTASVSFTVNDHVNLHGFGSFYSKGDNTVDVVIYEDDKVAYKADNITRMKTDSDCIGKVWLGREDLVQIKPGKVYTITEHTHSCRWCCGRPIDDEMIQFKLTLITFRSSRVALPKDVKRNKGQIPYLLLS
ncbi:BTB/POZ domain-containing protein 6-like [Ylistrum balloti]|uniref:BTB/POZ domain-containing protein 6-like n=1 Tax=Ylistrum balloti TaxID=509963 RepID=UPI002905D0C1|nr:BTB/POZ domain-containing protein 6-like [Ylistrum balloti]